MKMFHIYNKNIAVIYIFLNYILGIYIDKSSIKIITINLFMFLLLLYVVTIK